MEKVYIVKSETLTTDDFFSLICGVYKSKESALSKMKAEINDLCEDIRENLECDFEVENEELGYDSFEEYWEDWVAENFVTPTFWRYSNEDDKTLIVSIMRVDVED